MAQVGALIRFNCGGCGWGEQLLIGPLMSSPGKVYGLCESCRDLVGVEAVGGQSALVDARCPGCSGSLVDWDSASCPSCGEDGLDSTTVAMVD